MAKNDERGKAKDQAFEEFKERFLTPPPVEKGHGISPETYPANVKLGYDVFAYQLWESINRNRMHFDLALIDSRNHVNTLFGSLYRTIENKVETGDFLSKSMLSEYRLGTDRIWNIDEVAKYVAQQNMNLDTLLSMFYMFLPKGVAEVYADKVMEKVNTIKKSK